MSDAKPPLPASRALTAKDVVPLAYLAVGVKVTAPLAGSTATEPSAGGAGDSTSSALCEHVAVQRFVQPGPRSWSREIPI